MKKGYWCLLLAFIYMPLVFAETTPTQSEAIELARHTLAKQTNLPLESFKLDSVITVRWPDSSLGCPQPGMMYAQIVTPGYRVIFAASSNGVRHFVHVGAGRAIVCDETASTRSQTEKNLRFGQRWQQSQKAQQLLADRLSVAPEKIRIIGTHSIPTDKAGPRCQGGPANAQIQTIELSYRNRVYRYGIIDNQLVYCE